MEYRNAKTGAIIESPCKIKGGDWVEVKKTIQEPKKASKKLKKR